MPLIGGLAALAVVQLSFVQVAPPDTTTGRDMGALRWAAGPGTGHPARDRSARFAPPRRQLTSTPWTLRIGPQRPDLVRYNRVEAISLGVRAQVRPSTPFGPLSVTATARFGAGDRHLGGRVDIARESVRRRVVVSGYHELAAIAGQARPLGPANTLTALLWGRDDGDYYRRSGAQVEVTPPSARPRTFRVRLFAEYEEGVGKETDVQLPRLWDDERSFRPNLVAEDGWAYGASLELSGTTGTDRTRTRGGFETLAEAAYGDLESRRVSVEVDGTLALPGRMGLTAEAAAGTVGGSPPPQKLWYVGGPMSLRGYGPRSKGGEDFWRGRLELYRRYSFGRVLLFSDVAWAGSGDWGDDPLYAAGAGLAIIDGLVRIDGGWQLGNSEHDFRLDVYLDQVL